MKQKLIPGIDYIGISTPFYCIDYKKRLLLHKRSNLCRDEKGKWDPGSGQLEFGEDPRKNVLREVKEEYGCDGKIIGELEPISVLRIHEGAKTHWLALPFIIRVKSSEVKNNEPNKISELSWFNLSNLPRPLHSAFEKYTLETNRIDFLKKYLD